MPAGFSATFLLQPAVSAVTPEALPGDTVVITGSGFDAALTTLVTIGGESVPFSVVSSTELSATVPAGAPPGLAPVQVLSDTLYSTITSASQVLILGPSVPPAPPAPPAPPGPPAPTPPGTPEPPLPESAPLGHPLDGDEPVIITTESGEPEGDSELAVTGRAQQFNAALGASALAAIIGGIVMMRLRRGRVEASEYRR